VANALSTAAFTLLACILPHLAFAEAGASHAGMDIACRDAPRVDAVYPTSQTVPENVLRFYVYFTRAMQRHTLASSLRLLDSDNSEVEGALYRGRYELLSADGKRLTVLMNPGRVKTGLDSHERLGRALSAGETFTLVIGTEARDTRGCALRDPYQKHLRVVPARRQAVDPEAWLLKIPKAETREAIAVDLDRPYDHVSLYHRIRVRDRNGALVPGTIGLGENERSWFFTPRTAWRDANYDLFINTLLEDLAGNRVGRPFEVVRREDTSEAVAPAEDVALRFRPAPGRAN